MIFRYQTPLIRVKIHTKDYKQKAATVTALFLVAL